MRARTILIPTLLVVATMLIAPPGHATIYVSMEHPHFATWPNDADGDVAPTTHVTGASTNLNSPYGIDVDADFIYVANQVLEGVTVYPVGADADTAPVRQINGTLTRLGGGGEGIAIDSNWIYVTTSRRIVVFPLDADGNAAPARVIEGSNTTLSSAWKVDVDSNWIYVTDVSDNAIKVFPIGADGNVSPARTIKGASTELAGHYAIAVDSNWIYTANYGIQGNPPHNVLVFPIGADGDIPPTRKIEGASTTLNQPYGIDVDSEWIYVANYNDQSVVVFPIDGDGDIPPTRKIAGASTPFDGWPSGIAVYAASAAIPVLDEWGLVMLALLLAISGLVAWRARLF